MPSAAACNTANDITCEVWIVETVASFNITADSSRLPEPIQCHVSVTVGGDTRLHATHLGSGQLGMDIGGKVLFVTLSDVSYVPDCNDACLISWTRIDMLGHFRMIGQHDMIIVQRKSDRLPLLIGQLMQGCYQVPPLRRHNEIYTAATDFWHQALAHSSPHFCSNTGDIFGDACMLPWGTNEFFCPACATYKSEYGVPMAIPSPQSENLFHLIH